MMGATIRDDGTRAAEDALRAVLAQPVGEPVRGGWREGTLTRAKELESLTAWVLLGQLTSNSNDVARADDLFAAIQEHIKAARGVAKCRFWPRRPGKASLHERAISNLDAAEAHLLHMAPWYYVLGQMPSLLNHVQRHLNPTDPRRKHFELVAERLGVTANGSAEPPKEVALEETRSLIEVERGKIVSTARGASSAALREQVRVRDFRNVVVAAIGFLTLLAVGLAMLGFNSPTTVPLCFQPERSAETMVVCPTAQSAVVRVTEAGGPPAPDIDDMVERTAAPEDIFVVELIGLAAAAVAAAAAIRTIRGSSERYGLPVALAILKLPTGALTAFLGLLLMRGQFVPGLTALDTSAQILAWALVFGYAQQLFTRLVDQQAHTVLNKVRGGQEAAAPAIT